MQNSNLESKYNSTKTSSKCILFWSGSGSPFFWASSCRIWGWSCFSSQVSSNNISIWGSLDFPSRPESFRLERPLSAVGLPVHTAISLSTRWVLSNLNTSETEIRVLCLQATPRGTFGYSTRQYSVSDHFYTARSTFLFVNPLCAFLDFIFLSTIFAHGK